MMPKAKQKAKAHKAAKIRAQNQKQPQQRLARKRKQPKNPPTRPILPRKKIIKSMPKRRKKREITVSFSITCKNAVDYGRSDIPQSGYFIRPEDYSGKEGITVFDVLEAECKSRGIELTYKDKYYIQGIGGLKEKECGGGSGWMYRVNGVAPHKAAVGYYLKDGDVVEWYYVTNINDN